MEKEPLHIVVIGASAGGLNALSEFVGQIQPEWDASWFVVLHLSRKGIGDFLLHRLQRVTKLSCLLAADGIPIEKGKIYIAQPGHHLLLKKGVVRIGHGPEENRWKPSIDVLFRSAVAAYDGSVIGIVLTGLLNDGTTGMSAIKRGGGTTIVQDPNEAEYPDMPLSVLNNMEVDHCVSLGEMGKVLEKVISIPPAGTHEVPEDILKEAEIAEKMASGIDLVGSLGKSSAFTCPDCGGMLTEINYDAIKRFKCHTGHSYSEEDLVVAQSRNIESTLWVALRMMEERRSLLKNIEQDNRKRGFFRFADETNKKGSEIEIHIKTLKDLLFETQSDITE